MQGFLEDDHDGVALKPILTPDLQNDYPASIIGKPVSCGSKTDGSDSGVGQLHIQKQRTNRGFSGVDVRKQTLEIRLVKSHRQNKYKQVYPSAGVGFPHTELFCTVMLSGSPKPGLWPRGIDPVASCTFGDLVVKLF